MATTYDGINYFPVSVNFMEENAMEVIEVKYGIKGSAIVLKLMCKIYKEHRVFRFLFPVLLSDRGAPTVLFSFAS